MKILFRVDASIQIGAGHVIRCLTLADALRAHGHSCEFICQKISGNLIELIEERGFLTYPIARNSFTDNQFDWEEDFNSTKNAIIESEVYDWIVIDHYFLDAKWESSIKKYCKKLMVIDDIANRTHNCDILLDQNYEDEARYNNLIQGECKKLLGPKYALLSDEYIKARRFRDVNAKISRVFIFFGGSDVFNLTEKSLLALCSNELNFIDVDVVIGSSYAHFDSLKLLATDRGRTNIYTQIPHLANLMAVADIAIGAGGVTNWERMCAGLPSIVISVAENQQLIAQILHQKGMLNYLGRHNQVTIKAIRRALQAELTKSVLLKKMSDAMNLCDGRGVSRVLKNMNVDSVIFE
jgi:UDP-2,4-diacetamido-2,4,6-trideoxy-beta-L-altropyranose hydrolase